MMPELFPNVEAAVANQTLVVRNVDDDGNLMAPAGFSTRLSRCLVCNTQHVFQNLEAHGTDAEHYHDTLVTMTISDVQFIAFKEDETTHISDSGECNKCVMDIAEAPEDRFFVTGSAGEVCIILDVAAKFVIPYKMYDNSTGHGMFNLPTQNETTVSGQCDERRQTVSVTFFEDWVLSASFEKDDMTSSGNYNVSDLSLTFTYSDERFVDPHPSIVDTTATVHLSMGNQTTLDPFQAALGQYFKCQKEQTLLLADENGNGARLDTYKFDFQAFKETNDNDFSDAQNFHECSSGGGGGSGGAENGDSNAIVHVVIALVVGLAALLLLAVFLIKRQRARSSYQSM
ncbi:lysosome-associated membrane glycoprotein 5-like [Lingula anatina]|uniref:Lysosome-associated membrane glycoprotein 5 n=1 Tax=Lingula anatina TaxID=7574 RepID=A0A1S3J034_LINAN|nr:lysosome-associated membrane glycoprotein 5-like [Lingula anatina]|eukprot:XP_013403164.1 lysosome-associated membrane glycoprotein 5-like [Lingula anatina]